MEVRATIHSQIYRLVERLDEAQINHDTEHRVDLPGVRAMAFADSWFSLIAGAPETPAPREAEVFFCNMGRIGVREQVAGPGDARPHKSGLDSFDLVGFKVDQSGVYDIENALVQSNGRLRVVCDEKTKITPRIQADTTPFRRVMELECVEVAAEDCIED